MIILLFATAYLARISLMTSGLLPGGTRIVTVVPTVSALSGGMASAGVAGPSGPPAPAEPVCSVYGVRWGPCGAVLLAAKPPTTLIPLIAAAPRLAPSSPKGRTRGANGPLALILSTT